MKPILKKRPGKNNYSFGIPIQDVFLLCIERGLAVHNGEVLTSDMQKMLSVMLYLYAAQNLPRSVAQAMQKLLQERWPMCNFTEDC